MDSKEMKDMLGNTVVVGDRVATAMVSRTAGNIRVGTVTDMAGRYADIKMDGTNATVSRAYFAFVKVAQ